MLFKQQAAAGLWYTFILIEVYFSVSRFNINYKYKYKTKGDNNWSIIKNVGNAVYFYKINYSELAYFIIKVYKNANTASYFYDPYDPIAKKNTIISCFPVTLGCCWLGLWPCSSGNWWDVTLPSPCAELLPRLRWMMLALGIPGTTCNQRSQEMSDNLGK